MAHDRDAPRPAALDRVAHAVDEGARKADTRRIEEWLSEEHPDVALEVHQGDQPLYPYLLGIE